MVRLIRRFEERAVELARSGDIPGGVHPYLGQEAVAAGVCAALRPGDAVLSNHRGHGHLLAKGSQPGPLLAELAGRATGLARGRAGSLHPSDPAVGVLGATATVGHGAAIATGVAFALAGRGDGIAVAFFGDGAVNQGALLEALNLAVLWRLPVLFVCENNGYATTLPVRAAVAGSIVERAAAFGMPASTVDGMDAHQVYRDTVDHVARARDGGGPGFLECVTYRFGAHHTFEHRAGLRYRDEAELDRWRARDPVLVQGERVPAGRRAEIDARIEEELDEAVRFALGSPVPDPGGALDHIYATGIPVRLGVYGA
jgi:pyruvate dehydrogenase E1 component alpha subunit